MSNTQFYFAMFGFSTHALYVEYGNGLPSHSVWMIPGSWEDYDA